MSIVSGFKKVKNYIKETDGYKLLSRWTSSDTVDVNGKTLTEAINGLNTSINGKANSVHTHGNGDITSLDASKITSGTIDIDRLPQGALDRLIKVADDTARFKLTTKDVQLGDSVKVTSTKKMYIVVDETKLSSEDGYEPYTADSATSVPWSGVTGKPSTYTPSSHTHTKSQITDFPTSMPANCGNSSTVNGHTVKSDVPENAVFTDTVYDDTEVKGEVDEINSNLVLLAKSDKGASNNICGAYGKYYYPLSVGDVLTISKKDSSVSILESNMVRLNQYDANGNKVDYWQLHDDALPRTVTISKKSVYIGFNKDTTDTPLMVNVGSSAMAYEPYIPSV